MPKKYLFFISLSSDCALPFNLDIKFFRKLKTLEIKNSKKLYLSSLNNSSLDCLKLENLKHFSFDACYSIKIFKVVLRNMIVDYPNLINLITISNVKHLVFRNVKMENYSENLETEFYNSILKSKILSFDTRNSFVCFDLFRKIILNKKIASFHFRSNSDITAYKSIGTKLNYCVLKSNDQILTASYFKTVEILCLISQNSLFALQFDIPFLIQIHLENISIDSSIIKKFPKFKSAIFSN